MCFWWPGRSLKSLVRESTTAGSRHGWLGSGSSSQCLQSCVVRRRNRSFAIKSTRAFPVFIASGATILVQSHSTLRRKNYPDSGNVVMCGSRGMEYAVHPFSQLEFYIFCICTSRHMANSSRCSWDATFFVRWQLSPRRFLQPPSRPRYRDQAGHRSSASSCLFAA